MSRSGNVVARLIADGVAPVAAAGCAGKRGLDMGGAISRYFDLASITKPFTALAVARSGLDVRTPLGALLDEARGTPSDNVSLELLLAHRAGLLPHVPYYERVAAGLPLSIADVLGEMARARRPGLDGPPPEEGFPPEYSDLGYILAGVALARALSATDAGEATQRLVIDPFGLTTKIGTARALSHAAADFQARAVPTETVPWRGGPIVGVVHDDNAWVLSGLGGSGHAGLFGTIEGVIEFGLIVLEEARRGSIDWMIRARPLGTLRAGFDGKNSEGSSAGTLSSMSTFGHLGFTGTSLWIDPEHDAVVSLLTNRVCPSRDNLRIRGARPWAHDELFAIAGVERGQKGDNGPTKS